jgi:hypothetical protein
VKKALSCGAVKGLFQNANSSSRLVCRNRALQLLPTSPILTGGISGLSFEPLELLGKQRIDGREQSLGEKRNFVVRNSSDTRLDFCQRRPCDIKAENLTSCGDLILGHFLFDPNLAQRRSYDVDFSTRPFSDRLHVRSEKIRTKRSGIARLNAHSSTLLHQLKERKALLPL